MTSILTNTGSMVALQTLKSINMNLSDVQSQISTGKKVASAKDSSAIFAISKVMEADVAGFESVSQSLSLGQSTVGVAAAAAQEIGSLLEEIKGKVITANEANVDRTKLNDEITSLRNQINGIVSTAQFNGLNLLDGTNDGAGGFSILSSLNRGADGTVTTGNIAFDPTNSNLSATAGTDLVAGTNPASAVTAGTAAAAVTDIAGTAGTPDVGLTNAELTARGLAAAQVFGLAAAGGAAPGAAQTFQLGGFLALQADGTAAAAGVAVLEPSEVNLAAGTSANGLVAGDSITFGLGFTEATYTVQAGDTSTDIAAGIRTALIEAGVDSNAITLDTQTNAGQLTVVNTTEQSYTGYYQIERASGGLAGLSNMNVTTAAGAQLATSQIETFIQNATDAQAQLGTIQKRLEIQDSFMSKLIDSFKTGIGSLVDADMEAASARLQALQTQQQLGIQALSIANQAPQNVLALFR